MVSPVINIHILSLVEPLMKKNNLSKLNIFPETTNNISLAAEIVRQGGIIACLTDTLYGLVADATNSNSVTKIFRIKSRGENKPLLILVDNFEVASKVAIFSWQAKIIAEKFWPGPLTLILPRQNSCMVVKEINPVSDTIAIRIPDRARTLELIDKISLPITAPSANLDSKKPAQSAEEIFRAFGSNIDLILDAGVSKNLTPSTVVDLTSSKPKIIREGVILECQITEVIKR